MSKTDRSGPAFPCEVVKTNEHGEQWKEPLQGMTLRDYFAIKVLPLAWNENCTAIPLWQRAESNDWMNGVANDAYSMADAMLKARKI